MEPSQWQNDLRVQRDERPLSKKMPLFALALSRKQIMIGLIALFIIGFILYSFSSPSSLPDHQLPLLKGPTEPYKIKPIHAETDKSGLQNKTIYEKLLAKNPDEKIESLLNEPEEPPILTPALPDDFIGNLFNEEENKIQEPFSNQPNSFQISKEMSSFSSEKPVSLDNNKTSLSNNPSSPKENIDELEQSSSLTVTVPTAKSKSKTLSTFDSKDKETYWVQLASLKSKDAAEREWKRLCRLSKLKSLLNPLKPTYGRVDMGQTEGIHFRLRIGPFPSDEAKKICQTLKTQGVGCLLKKG